MTPDWSAERLIGTRLDRAEYVRYVPSAQWFIVYDGDKRAVATDLLGHIHRVFPVPNDVVVPQEYLDGVADGLDSGPWPDGKHKEQPLCIYCGKPGIIGDSLSVTVQGLGDENEQRWYWHQNCGLQPEPKGEEVDVIDEWPEIVASDRSGSAYEETWNEVNHQPEERR